MRLESCCCGRSLLLELSSAEQINSQTAGIHYPRSRWREQLHIDDIDPALPPNIDPISTHIDTTLTLRCLEGLDQRPRRPDQGMLVSQDVAIRSFRYNLLQDHLLTNLKTDPNRPNFQPPPPPLPILQLTQFGSSVKFVKLSSMARYQML